MTPPSPEKELIVEPLKDAVAELTVEKQQLKDQIEKLRKKIKNRDKQIEALERELEGETSEKPSKIEKSSRSRKERRMERSQKSRREKKERAREEEKIQERRETVLTELRQELGEVMTAMETAKEAAAADKEELEELRKQMKMETKKNSNEVDETTIIVAKRTLEVLRRNQLLQNALNYKETQQLHQFFTTDTEKHPSDTVDGDELLDEDVQVLMLLDKALSSGIDKLMNHSYDLDDVIDNEMRHFLFKTTSVCSHLTDERVPRRKRFFWR